MTAANSTERLDRGKKLRVYAKAGIGHAWLVDARKRMLEVYRLHDGKWLLLGVHTDGDHIRAEPFETLELDLATLWIDLPARASEEVVPYELST